MPIAIELRLATELSVQPSQVRAAVELLDEGATVPFIARYRKEATGGLDDTQLRDLAERLTYLRELDERRIAVLQAIEAQGKLTGELAAAIDEAATKQRLEDLYAPYKTKRRTKAQIAREAGLEPLALALLEDPTQSPEALAQGYLCAAFSSAEGDNPGVPDAKAALEGARQILMERFAEDAQLVGWMRELLHTQAVLCATLNEGKAEAGAKYADYFNFSEPLAKIPSHRALAVLRGRREDVLKLALKLPEELEAAEGSSATGGAATRATALNRCEQAIAQRFAIRDAGRAADAWLIQTVRWTWQVKLAWQLETELLGWLREQAEAEAIRVFGRNLKEVLLAAPAGQRTTLGLDPGIRTGVKVAVVSATGKLEQTATVFPHAPRNDWDGSIATLASLCARHQVELVAIGNGTASRETEKLVQDLIKRHPELKLTRAMVSEAGASVYSASALAAQEFPDLDVSLRGAVSIARRLQDPLAELVKIDPKSIGVGQYQHDVSQTRLARQLDAVVEDCVNAVGVNLNTASAPLLSRVSGLSTTLAENIVRHRDQHGPFGNRGQLLQVPRVGEKTFEQAAGFLRIIDGDDPLDASAVHPEAYPVVKAMLAELSAGVKDVIGQPQRLRELKPQRFVDERFGLPTVLDILRELEKPGRDPRPAFKSATFKEGVETPADLRAGMILEGVVTNVANFGAFVDIGVHQDGLVHVSALSKKFVRDPHEVVKTGDLVQVKVLSVDLRRQRIALTLRLDDPLPTEETRAAPGQTSGRPQGSSARSGHAPQRTERAAASRAAEGALALALAKARERQR